MIDLLIEKLKQLRLNTIADNLSEVLIKAEQKNWSLLKTMEYLLKLEIEQKRQNKMALCFRQSKLLKKNTIDQFDFNYHVSRKKQKTLINNLLSLEFINNKKDIIFIGTPGAGKSFIANCIAYEATRSTYKVLFTTAIEMINQLIAAESDHTLLKKLNYYQSPTLLIIDEAGYLPLGKQGSNLFFQVISKRHEYKSTIITTNLPFANWGNIFDSTTVATAIADRLVNNSDVIVLEGPSYRSRNI